MSVVKIKGELFWAKWMNELNTKFNPDNDRFEAVVGNISDEDVKKLGTLGIKIKNKEGQGNFILAKSKYEFAPTTPSGDSVAIEDIGNGTKVEVELSSYTHRMSAMHGNAPSIKKITVTSLEKYEPEDGKVAVTDIDDDDIL
jgi:hypothetical protein